MTEVPSI